MHPCQDNFPCVYLSTCDDKRGKCMLAHCAMERMVWDDGEETVYDSLRDTMTPWMTKTPTGKSAKEREKADRDAEYNMRMLERQKLISVSGVKKENRNVVVR